MTITGTPESLTLSGYDDRKELLAQRYSRSGKSVFMISLPLHLVATHLPIPDPDKPFEGNRRVNATRAAKFGDYWRANTKWATPPLLLDTMYPLGQDFEPRFKAGGVEFGVVRMPHNTANELDILDGQHRVLGWKIVSDKIAAEMKKAREALQTAKELGDPAMIGRAQVDVDRLASDQQRLRDDYVTLEILEGVTVEEHKQAFHDIAVHAKGIPASLTVSFDRRNVMNRAAQSLAEEYALLEGRIDFEKDRVAGGNENVLSGRNLVDIVKHVVLGIDGRMTVRREKSFDEGMIEDLAVRFFDAMVESFSALAKVAADEIPSAELRASSLLGSPTVLRVLAGTYHKLAIDLTDEDRPRISEDGDAVARKLFASLAPHMGLPIKEFWFDTGFFPERDSKAPSSRSQDLKGLTDQLTVWATDGTPLK